jgi:hypothetical protein
MKKANLVFWFCYSEKNDGRKVAVAFCFNFAIAKKATIALLPLPSCVLVLLQQKK